jgi:hypothetical protein
VRLNEAAALPLAAAAAATVVLLLLLRPSICRKTSAMLRNALIILNAIP